jgi:hypothetical protein
MVLKSFVEKNGVYFMNKFVSWGIAVAIVMVLVLGMFWLKGGIDQAKPVAIFFAGWIAGAIAMYIKAKLVYKF